MSDEVDEAFVRIERRLYTRTVEAAQKAGAEIGKAIRRRTRRPRAVSIQDVIAGFSDPPRPVTVEKTPTGATVRVASHYERVNGAFRSAASNDPQTLLRTKLFVHRKTPGGFDGPIHDVTFDEAPRLALWAHLPERGFQVLRRSVWLDGEAIAKRLLVDPALALTQGKLSEFVREALEAP